MGLKADGTLYLQGLDFSTKGVDFYFGFGTLLFSEDIYLIFNLYFRSVFVSSISSHTQDTSSFIIVVYPSVTLIHFSNPLKASQLFYKKSVLFPLATGSPFHGSWLHTHISTV